MPRHSPFRIVLSASEKRELSRRAAKYTLPYFEVARARMILHAAEGLANDEIARRLDTRREVVSLWRKRFFTERLAGLEELPDRADPGLFPPEVVVQIKALACEPPCQQQVPLARWSVPEIARHAVASGLVASISDTTIWRWLHQDAIRPWQHRCWIFPRDPDFAVKAGRLLDLYEGVWQDQPLRDDEFVLSADEKTSIQARSRIHATEPPRPHCAMKVEHEYERRGAWAYLAAWDVHQAKVFGRCETQSGIAPFDRLVEQVMGQAPYQSARRVFWIVDNGSSHRGQKAVTRLQSRYRNLTLVHGPVHASWLNQIEIYFSILQQKVLTPNDFPSLAAVAERLAQFERHYEQIAQPFQWRFTRRNLNDWLEKLAQQDRPQSVLAA